MELQSFTVGQENGFMAATLLPPPLADEPSISDVNTFGGGGGPADPDYDPQGGPEPDPQRSVTPQGAYRLVTYVVIVWVAVLFCTLTLVLESRWVHSKDWVAIPLPHVLYLNTAILLLSSLTVELARSSVRSSTGSRCARWMLITLLLGLAFLGGQIAAWRELTFRGLHLGSNPGSFFLYLITGAHGLHLVGGIILLASVALFLGRLADKEKRETAVSAAALYWHFMDGLWCYLLVLLFAAIQR
jgi:cytochrome c oxidase subunit III